MKGVLKGKMVKKLKTIKAIGYLKPERFLHVNALDGYLLSSSVARAPLSDIREESPNQSNENSFLGQEAEIIDVSELMKDLEDREFEFDCDVDDKENVVPERKTKLGHELKGNLGKISSIEGRNEICEGKELGIVGHESNGNLGIISSIETRNEICVAKELGIMDRGSKGNLGKISSMEASNQICEGGKLGIRDEIDVWGFRRPDLNSITLFDPNLLAAFKQAVMEVKARESERRSRNEYINCQEENVEEQPPLKSRKIDETIDDPLLEFEEKCPPGGIDSVILYTTGLRGIRKTFEDCHKIRSLLENLRILFFERDVSMHSGYKEEMWGILGGKIVPPRLFIKGRYIGGADEVLGLHEQGKLKPLIEGIAIDKGQGPCQGCGGIRFVVCLNCNGSRKIVLEGSGVEGMNCSECNENGVVICPFCC